MIQSAAQAAEVERALAGHVIQLERTLEDEAFWTHDLHVPVATQLRTLLCDRRFPILLEMAKYRGLSLRIWGPRPPGSGLDTRLTFQWTALVASWTPDGGGFEMSIEEYLDTGVAVIPLDGKGRAFSPRQIIKWVANKEGGAHFSFDRPATLRALRKSTWKRGDVEVDSFGVKQVVFFVGLWAHAAIGACLGMIPPNDRPARDAS